jgi:DNA-binding NtrC family response regulator
MNRRSDPRRAKTILLVDDDLNFRRVLKYKLRGLGLAVEEVEDWRTAVACCKQHIYDLVIADVNVPVMRGLDSVKLIKGVRPEIPVLIISAFSSPENRMQALNFGASDFLEKPCEESQLLEKIDRLLV